jgi:Ca-activated chloride channel family protein
MKFGQPDFLYLLIALPVAGAALYWSLQRRKTDIQRIGNSDLIARLYTSVNQRGRTAKLALWFVAFALVVISLSRPQWGTQVQIVEQQGSQVMIALDISNSMLAEDIKPDRLTRAKLEISDLMTKLGGDEVGLVLFSGASFIQFPLTFDYSTARSFLENAHPGMISRQGTAIGDAIETAIKGFDETRPSQRVIIILTDGEEHEGDPVGAASDAARRGRAGVHRRCGHKSGSAHTSAGNIQWQYSVHERQARPNRAVSARRGYPSGHCTSRKGPLL